MDVRFVLTLVLWVVMVVVLGAIGYALTGSMRFVAGYLNYITLPTCLIVAGFIAYRLPCHTDCPLRQSA